VPDVHVSDALLDYLQALVAHTRNGAGFAHGLSPRASLALLRGAQSWALIDGRDFVLPEDLQAVFGPVAGHRLFHNETNRETDRTERLQHLLQSVAIP
jgi:MoxR-like ATPase